MSLNSFFLALLSARAASLSQFLLPAHSVVRGLLHPSDVVKVGNRDTRQPFKAHITENQKSAFHDLLGCRPGQRAMRLIYLGQQGHGGNCLPELAAVGIPKTALASRFLWMGDYKTAARLQNMRVR